VFDLCARGIEQMLHLRRPIYAAVAAGGHFGRPDLDLPWEQTDKIDALHAALDTKRPSPYVAT
jgi:S-adenosylmethionine synthetase